MNSSEKIIKEENDEFCMSRSGRKEQVEWMTRRRWIKETLGAVLWAFVDSSHMVFVEQT